MVTPLRRQGCGHDVPTSARTQLEARHLTINDELVEIRVSRSDRARVARIILGPRRPLEAVVPPTMTMKELDRFLVSKRAWIAKKLAAVETIVSRPHRLGLDRPNTMWLGGAPLPVSWLRVGRPVARLQPEREVRVGGRTSEEATAALTRLYRREAAQRLRDAVNVESARLGLEPNAVAVRDQQTRWGSCSAKGNLSFSWRLALAPPDVLRYVVVHELCHLREPSHSKRYWQILEAAYPGWQEPARWLRENGHELHAHIPVVMSSES
jgi:predicted metal-dependent hydrolase